MIVSINQPAYLPWLGYYDRIRRSDLHIVLDHVQFEKGSYTNRARIKQRDGREMWLTVPVKKGYPIAETRVAGFEWRRKHVVALEQTLRGLPFALGYLYIGPKYRKLGELCHASIVTLNSRFDDPVTTECVTSTSLGGDKLGRKSELVLNLCKEVGATQYLSGPNGRDYLDLPAFDKAGVEVLYHDFPTDGDWGLSAVHHLSRSFTWPHLDLTSAHSSQASAEAGVVAPHSSSPLPTSPAS